MESSTVTTMVYLNGDMKMGVLFHISFAFVLV